MKTVVSLLFVYLLGGFRFLNSFYSIVFIFLSHREPVDHDLLGTECLLSSLETSRRVNNFSVYVLDMDSDHALSECKEVKLRPIERY